MSKDDRAISCKEREEKNSETRRRQKGQKTKAGRCAYYYLCFGRLATEGTERSGGVFISHAAAAHISGVCLRRDEVGGGRRRRRPATEQNCKLLHRKSCLLLLHLILLALHLHLAFVAVVFTFCVRIAPFSFFLDSLGICIEGAQLVQAVATDSRIS